jgi:hypothetical protein
VVLLKRTLADSRKQEAERIEAALRDQKRKIARREARQPSLLDKFLQTKCVVGLLAGYVSVCVELSECYRRACKLLFTPSCASHNSFQEHGRLL